MTFIYVLSTYYVLCITYVLRTKNFVLKTPDILVDKQQGVSSSVKVVEADGLTSSFVVLTFLNMMVIFILENKGVQLGRNRFENFENAWEVKESKCENHIKMGPKIRDIIRGFQIWPQKSNWITLTHF